MDRTTPLRRVPTILLDAPPCYLQGPLIWIPRSRSPRHLLCIEIRVRIMLPPLSFVFAKRRLNLATSGLESGEFCNLACRFGSPMTPVFTLSQYSVSQSLMITETWAGAKSLYDRLGGKGPIRCRRR